MENHAIILFGIWLLFGIVNSAEIGIENARTVSRPNCNLEDGGKDEMLIITDCTIPMIPNKQFKDNHLVTLNISNCDVGVINDNAFGLLDQLKVLVINGNRIQQVQAWSDHDLNQLHSLDLRRNHIIEIDANALCRYPNLVNLTATDNAIERLVNGTMKCTPGMQWLDLARNNMTIVESFTFNGLTQLVHLFLQENKIEYVNPFAFTSLTQLGTLRLDGNRLTAVDSRTFSTLLKLSVLNMRFNSLATIATDTFISNGELRHLDLSHNVIAELAKESLRGLDGLQVFNASSNKLTDLQPAITSDLPSLQYLILSANKLTHLHDYHFANHSTITLIDLSDNSIEFIPKSSFSRMRSLKFLNLATNILSDDTFLENLSDIKSLNLSHNHYTSLNISLLSKIAEVELIGNYWLCSWLIPELVHNRIHSGVNFVLDEPGWHHKFNALEEIDCYDHRRINATKKNAILRHVIIVHPLTENCGGENRDSEQKFSSINTYPRTFNKLLSDEFDYKACLVWTAIGVFLVVGLIRLGKYVFEKSERKSEILRATQQERLRHDIDAYLLRPRSDSKSRS